MRMEELSENRYIKGTDTVEKYLLDVVRKFFKQQDFKSPETSREYIIEQAVERMKEELAFDKIGVLTIQMPDGTERAGVVNITLEELGGEPAISPKLSAFNVSFGDKQNTACEGNDPRLSDKREPLEHQHDVNDIIGLQGIMSTLQGKFDRISDVSHEHENLDVLDMLVYTGSNASLDLTVLDNFDDIIQNAISQIENRISAYKNRVENSVTNLDTRIDNVLQNIQSLEQYVLVTNQNYLQNSKTYTETKISEFDTAIQSQIGELVTRDLLSPILGIANNVNTFIGNMDFTFSSVLHHIPGYKRLTATVPVDAAIINELTQRGQTLRNCQTECFLEYDNPDVNKRVKVALPYITCINNTFDGSLRVDTLYDDNEIMITLDTQSEQIAAELLNAKFIYNVYSMEPVTL